MKRAGPAAGFERPPEKGSESDRIIRTWAERESGRGNSAEFGEGVEPRTALRLLRQDGRRPVFLDELGARTALVQVLLDAGLRVAIHVSLHELHRALADFAA